MSALALSKLKQRTLSEKLAKPKRKFERFDGLTEEQVQRYTLPDYLANDLDLVFVGINPSLMAAHRGRYYAGPGNHFYKLLHVSGLVPRFVTFEEDHKLMQYGIGLTNIVERPTRSSADLKRTELKEGAKIVAAKLKRFAPKIAVFNGKCIYEVYASKTDRFNFGLQPETIGNTVAWVVPSSSARCANFPRMEDKLRFYIGIKKYLSFLKGESKEVDVTEFRYEGKCKPFVPSTSKMWRRKNLSAFMLGGRIANKDTVSLDTSEESVALACSTEFVVTETVSRETNPDARPDTHSDTHPDTHPDLSIGREIDTREKRCRDTNENPSNENLPLSNAFIPKEKIKKQRQKKVKRLPPKPPTAKRNVDANGMTDFVSLIRERLQKKEANRTARNEAQSNWDSYDGTVTI